MTIKQTKQLQQWRKLFPWFINHPDLIYFDNAATSLKPSWLKIEPKLSSDQNLILKEFNNTQKLLATYLDCSASDVYFTHGATYAINFLVRLLAENFQKDDEVLLNYYEHNANLIPWIQLANNSQIKIKYVEITNFLLTIDDIVNAITPQTKVISIASQTNLTGNLINIEQLVKAVRKKKSDCIFIIDATQTLQHHPIACQKMQIDFLFGSAHKIYGPNGVGFFYADLKYAKQIQAITNVSEWVLHAQNFAQNYFLFDYYGIINFSQSLQFLMTNSLTIQDYEQTLIAYFNNHFPKNSKFELIHTHFQSPIFLIRYPNIPAEDLGYYLNQNQIIVRSGNACVGLLNFAIPNASFVRISLSFLNSIAEIDRLFYLLKQFCEQDLLAYLN